MDYKEALQYIHGTYKFGSKLGLENIQDLLSRLGSPHKPLF
jgi:dihydrofolate synthase/folylpolyglutamate synthase